MNPVTLDCPHATECPGCPLFELDYASTLEVKRSRLTRNVAAYPELAHIETPPTVPGDPITHYRRRAKLVVHRQSVGLYARSGHRVLDLPQCRVLEPAIEETVQALRGSLPASMPIYAIDLRNSPDGVLVTFVVDEHVSLDDAKLELERLKRRLPRVVGIAVSRRPRRSPQLLGRDLRVLSGPDHVRVPGSEAPYAYEGQGTFAQTHAAQAEALQRAIIVALKEHLGSLTGKRILELFSGVGALSLRLSALGADVTAVEAYGPAADLARLAADEQKLRVTIHAMDAAAAVRASIGSGERFDAIIVNPPRRGVAPDLRASIAVSAPQIVVYVSCRAETLTRDSADWARKGLRAERFVPYDMMPWTEQIETLAVFVPGAPAPLQVIHHDERLIAVIKGPHEPTTPQGEHQYSLLERVRAEPSWAGAVPVHRLDIGTSGVCLFAKHPDHVASLSRMLAEGRKEYLALARGIVRPKGSIKRPTTARGRALPARTRYKRVEAVGGHSLLSVRPDEERKHQIRVHLASIGHPILGDARYGDRPSNEHFEFRHGLDRPFLHCARIVLSYDDKDVDLRAPLAPDLASVLESMRRGESDD